MPDGRRRRRKASMPQRIIITGASSGIGMALAQRYAREGASLGLLGRHKERLESVVPMEYFQIQCDRGVVCLEGIEFSFLR